MANDFKQLQSDAGMTVLLTTHYMEEADELADRIAFMNEGRIVAEGTPEEMKNKVGGGHDYDPMPRA